MKPIKEVVTWQPIIDGKKRDVPLTVLYHPQAIESGKTQLHFYSGLGEENILTGYGVQKLAECDLPAIGVILPFHYLEPTSTNIQRTLIEVPQFIAETFNKRAGNPIDKPVDLIGKSQGGGAVLLSATYAPKRFRIIASLLPAGFNKHALGNTPKERLRELKRRLIILNNLTKEQSLFEAGNILAWYEVTKRFFYDLFTKRLNPKLDYTLAMDLTKLPEEFISLSELSKTHKMAIFAGKTDPVVRIEEIRSSLRSIGLEHVLHEVPSIHANSASRAGQQQLELVAKWIKETREKVEKKE